MFGRKKTLRRLLKKVKKKDQDIYWMITNQGATRGICIKDVIRTRVTEVGKDFVVIESWEKDHSSCHSPTCLKVYKLTIPLVSIDRIEMEEAKQLQIYNK